MFELLIVILKYVLVEAIWQNPQITLNIPLRWITVTIHIFVIVLYFDS